MARRFVLSDDLDGTESTEDNEVMTWEFSYGGSRNKETRYIDLTEANFKKLTDALAPFIDASRTTRNEGESPSARPRAKATGAKTDKSDLIAVREWAKSKGIEVNERGRIKEETWEKWRADGSPRP